MSNRKLVGWIVGVGCLLQFAAWEASIDALVPGFVEPATSTPFISPSAAPTFSRRTPPASTREQPREPTAHRRGVVAGAACAPAGATGVTAAGRPMTCKSTASDVRNRWRSR